MAEFDLRELSFDDIVDGVRSGDRPAVAVVQAAIDRSEADNPTLNVWASTDFDAALERAAEIDQHAASGKPVPPLAGIPIGVKDLEDARGFPTSYGSYLHEDDPPATRDSVQVARLRAAGAIIMGKLTTSEFGYSGDTTTPRFGATVNPWNTARSSGGSSGGSAAAIAAGIVVAATGSDAGGSIRIPAALCGLSGFKSTHGIVPLGDPAPPSGGTLTVRGPMARTAAESRQLLEIVAGPVNEDPFALGPINWHPSVDFHGAKIAWWTDQGYPVDAEVAATCRTALDALSDAGAQITEVSPSLPASPLGEWFQLWSVYRERAHGHLRDTPDWDRFDPGLVALMDYGAEHVTATQLARALDSIYTLNLVMAELFRTYDVVASPTVAGQTALSSHQGTVNGEESIFWAPFTQLANLTRHPAGSINAGFTADCMPVGLQLIGPHRSDGRVLTLMDAAERVLATNPPRRPARMS